MSKLKVIQQLSETNPYDEVRCIGEHGPFGVVVFHVRIDHEDSNRYAMFAMADKLGIEVVHMTREEYHEFVSKLLEFDELF